MPSYFSKISNHKECVRWCSGEFPDGTAEICEIEAGSHCHDTMSRIFELLGGDDGCPPFRGKPRNRPQVPRETALQS